MYSLYTTQCIDGDGDVEDLVDYFEEEEEIEEEEGEDTTETEGDAAIEGIIEQGKD